MRSARMRMIAMPSRRSPVERNAVLQARTGENGKLPVRPRGSSGTMLPLKNAGAQRRRVCGTKQQAASTARRVVMWKQRMFNVTTGGWSLWRWGAR